MLPPLEVPVDNLLPMFQTEKPLTESQIRYAAFPANLKAAMKIAAKRKSWTADDWKLQTRMVYDTLSEQPETRDGLTFHPATAEQIAAGYRQEAAA